MALYSNQLTTVTVVTLIIGILYFFTAVLYMPIIFVICVNTLLVLFELISVTKYYSNYSPYLRYAVAVSTIIFLFIVAKNIFDVL